MRQKYKRIIGLFLAVLILAFNAVTIFAQEPIRDPQNGDPQKMLTIDEYNRYFGHEEYNQRVATPRAAQLSDYKTSTKNIITNGGMNMGKVTIRYKTYMEGGRPKFAYDTVSISIPPASVGIWQLTDSDVRYNSDSIAVYYTYSSIVGSMTDYATVVFVPAG